RCHDLLLAVLHLHRGAAADHEPDVLDLAHALPGRRADVLRPPPARLVHRAPERHRADLEHLEVPLVARPRLGRIVEADERPVHGAYAPAGRARGPSSPSGTRPSRPT